MAPFTSGRIPWMNPLSTLRRVRVEVDRAFGGVRLAPAPEFPPINVWRGDDGIALTAEIPGIRLEDVAITVRRDVLTIRGVRRPEPDTVAAVHRRERGYGAFERTLTLPYPVDADRVTATADNGVLLVDLPRPASDRRRRIPIKAA